MIFPLKKLLKNNAMGEPLIDDEELLSPSFNVDDLLRDIEYGVAAGSSSPSIASPHNIWSSDGLHHNFLPYSNSWVPYSRFGDCNPADHDLLNPESDGGSDSSWRFDSASFDFNRAAQEGMDVYSRAFDQWGSMNGSSSIYNPFGSGSVIEEGVIQSVGVPKPSSLQRSVSESCNRPTFADVAKNKPPSPVEEPPNLTREGQAYESQESLVSLPGKKSKLKAFRPAHARHEGLNVPLPIKPDSKYGLDDFDLPSSLITKMERSMSCDDALDQRKCSQEETSNKDLAGDCSSGVGDGDRSDSNAKCFSEEWSETKSFFQNGGSRVRSESEPIITVLNNTATGTGSTSKASRRSNAAYINNLHDGSSRASKQTNSDRAGRAGVNGSAGSHSSTGAELPTFQSVSSSANIIGYCISGSIKIGKFVIFELFKYLLLLLIFIVGLTGQGVYVIAYHTCLVVTKGYSYLAVKVGLSSEAHTKPNVEDSIPFKFGLDENIPMPSTCEEAMNRLLVCQGKDAYSILGLRADSTDEEIRRFYRRQAVLVHPDKNQQPGAEEAFKILGQAFELIGNTEKRKLYDEKIQKEMLSEDIMRQFSDLMTKFHEKMEEASHWMQCSNCGDKHRRYLTDKDVNSARKCSRCQCYHSAKEGDIWAETTFMGFKWYFYACMENKIYDVTAWVSCQPSMVDKVQPNSHTVRLRMGLSHANGSAARHNPNTSTHREPDLENLLKNLFMQSPSGDSNAHSNGKPDWGSNNKKTSKKAKKMTKKR